MAEEAIFSFILDALRLVIQEAQFLHGVGDQVENLQQQLNQMHWFMRDTSSAGQDGQKRVLEWVVRVRNLAYEAENLVESYAFKVASHRRRGFKGKIKRIAGFLNECYHLHQIGSDIETLTSKITDFTSNFDRYGIRQILENRDDNEAYRRRPLRRTYSTTNDEDELFVGSHDDITNLAKKLVDGHYRTISLHGMGGLGKTTLARKVYHHPIVMEHFEGFSWVSISQQWQKDSILQGILIKLLSGEKRDEILKWRDEELVRELSQFLRTRKCLVVLDDIWTIDAWLSIEPAIPITKNRSKVMITTRNKEVATLLDGHGYLHNPRLLTADESWELLCKKALSTQNSQEFMKMTRIGKEMITYCRGLPLAVMALGGILSSRHSYDEWQNVLDNIKSYLRNDGILNVYDILAMSYDDLPFQLKPCFLYLSHYPEDKEIEVETLYQYWIAEGMVSRDDRVIGSNETMMDVAEHYVRELADRSLVFVEKKEGYSLTRFKWCRLHDLIREVCISKAKEEKFFESIDYRYTSDVAEASLASIRTTSRLSIYLHGEDDAEIVVPPLANDVRRSLRSFILVLDHKYNGKKQDSFNMRFTGFVMLRILSLEGISSSSIDGYGSILELPASIGKLVHLRYLSFRKFRSLIVTSSIGNLAQLQTLDLRYSKEITWKTNVVWKMARLTHLYLPYIVDPKYLVGKLKLDGLHKLEILEGFSNMICNVNDLSTLTNLRKLVARLDNKLEDMEELMNHVRKLTNLRWLELKINVTDLSSAEVLSIINNILSYNYLVNLSMTGKLSEWPKYDWGFCWRLQTLLLEFSEIEEDPLSALGKLPELKRLFILLESFVGKEMSCHASDFPQLITLHLGSLEKLERLQIEAGAMPNLSLLVLSKCSRLKMIPSGLRFITSLKTFHASSGMSEEFKESARLDLFDELRHIPTVRY